jgi:hypothetical protein
MEPRRFLALYHSYSKRNVAISGSTQSCDRCCRLKHSGSQSCSFKNEINCGCPGGCRGNIACYLPIMAANSWYIDVCDHSPSRLPKMQDQKLFTLHWCSFSDWGRECITFVSVYKGSLYLIYERVHPMSIQITQDARPIIIDSQLTLIFWMGQWAFLICFWL